MEEILVRFNQEGVGRVLSNLSKHRFIFRGVQCQSTEGILHSVKVNDPEFQRGWCMKHGVEAQRIPSKYKPDSWKEKQTLWWQGTPMMRTSRVYREFVKEMYYEVSLHCPDYRDALLSTKGKRLIHPMGPIEPNKTVLTRHEFTSALEWVRDQWISD
ncbi:homing endonuclease [Agrobacterium phage OLIVR5]|uniref:Homing endonuclease n=2 Tax=Caudoviricetes TaxID=2731619 RepID=A0A858MTZ4_9CAUD|nr:homing endonuclease [Agrobacterium phage OLIVR5]QIW87901.1 homing endonuclease [Agrobacterium phage OLIVR5]QIW88166.1 homing endonuclease [Agrobacterium phage OLIVR6]